MQSVPTEERADGKKSAAVSAARNRRARRVRRARVGVLIVLVIASGFVGMHVRAWRQRKAAVAQLREAIQGYTECMLGAPLDAGESATERMRRIEAGLPEVTASTAPLAPGDAWPIRCRTDIDRAHAVLVGYDGFGEQPFAHRLDLLLLRARLDPVPTDEPDLVDDILRAAPLVGVSAMPRRYPPPSRRRAPPPAAPLTVTTLPPLPVRARSAPDELRGGAPLSLGLSFFDPGTPRWTCVFAPLHGEPLREARCGEARAGAVSVTREEAPRGPGYLRTVRGRFDRFELVRWVPGADPDVTPLPTSIVTVGLYGDQLVWVTAHGFYARTVPAERAPLGPPVDLGDIDGTSPELQMCETSNALVVGVKTFDAALPERQSWRVMAARDGGTWTRTPGRALADVGATFTCLGHGGTWAWYDRHVVTEVACNADRCETRTSPPVVLPWDVGGALYTADLGGQALVLGLGTTPGALSGKSVTSVRMRMAPLAAIGEAPDVVLFSDAAHDGAPISDVSVYVRDAAAIALLTGDGPLPYRAIHIDELGGFEPVTLGN